MPASPAPSEDNRERLAEVAELLALALTRQIQKKSSRLSAENGESSLDISGHQSGD
jgi:hypothetical protein